MEKYTGTPRNVHLLKYEIRSRESLSLLENENYRASRATVPRTLSDSVN